MSNYKNTFFEYVCPSIGIFVSTALYSAPVKSLILALERKSLGALNPTPWGIMTGNCFGWLAYAYYARDPFVLASNIPGFILSFWLNTGASKLQYYMEVQSSHEPSDSGENSTKRAIVFTSQDKLMLGILSLWIAILICVGWLEIADGHEKEIIGIFVNINLLFFYGAPLQTIKIVFEDKLSDCIHAPTMILNCTNAGFWGAYGIAINNPVIYGPNCVGFFLGLCQATLCCMYPKTISQPSSVDVGYTALLDSSDGDLGTEVEDNASAGPTHHVV